MKVLLAVLVMLAFALGVACAGPGDDSGLSPEAKALKEKYDASIKALSDQFQKDLAALSAGTYKPGAPPAPAAPPKKSWADSLMINGYFQTRFEGRQYDGIANERDEFTLRRLYMNVISPVDNTTTAVVTYAGVGPLFREGGGGSFENIFVDYKPVPTWTIRMGQAPNWFGLDAAESSSIRIPPERALVTEGNTVLGLSGLYAFGPSDRGLWVTWDGRPLSPDKKQGLRVTGSVHNGQFQDTDKNNNKNVSLDAEYFTKWGQFGASWLDGMYTNARVTPTATQDRSAFGLNLRLFPGVAVPNWGFQAEWLDGTWLGTDRTGWYAQASYHFPDKQNIAYTRYEEFNPNKNAVNDTYNGLHLGVKHSITPMDDVTLEYVLGNVGRGSAGGDFKADDLFVQYQRKF